ncbi:MAG: PAS domain S-box protein [Candidatus Lokiarchaeota archaeon]|nr:PAS domain S-box protein [Candidatus Lokiarchaeota archaeon]
MEKRYDKEQELRDLEKRNKLFYEYAPLPYQSLDENVKIIDINQAWLDFVGYDKEEVIGKCFGEFLVLKSREVLNSRFSQFKEVGAIQNVEYEIVKKNGIHRIILLDGRIEYDDNGNFKQALCFFKDITERKRAEEELKESEEKFRNIAEQSFMSIYIIQDGLFKYFNQRTTEVNGYSKEDIQNWKPYEYAKVVHSEDRDFVLEQSRKKQEGDIEVINRYKYRIIKKSGEIAWINSISKTINYMGRTADLVMTEDITEKIVAEQKLKESEEKFRTLIENIPDTIYSSLPDETSTTLFLSNRWEDWTGIPVENSLKDPNLFFQTIHPDDREETNKIFAEAIKYGKEFILNYRIKHKDTGKEIYVRDHGVPIKNDKGEIINYNGVMTNITDLRKAEQKLIESEEKYKYIFDNAQVGLYWSSISDGKFLECNETFAKLFGYNNREECLTDYIATEHYIDPKQRIDLLNEIRANKEVRGYEILVTKRDGTPIWLSISARMFEKENRIEGAAINITKRKKAKQELIESEERYRKAYDKADFYKDLLAHDVSNIFNNINASVQLMKIWKGDYDISEKERKMTEIIKQQLERGASLVSNVRKLSEIEEGEMSLKSIDVKKVLDMSIEEIRSRFHEREPEISFKAVQEITNVVGGELLIDAFENLLINGVIHNDSEKIRLWIYLSKIYQEGKNFVKIEFKDNGLGIIDGRKNPIFERNYKNDRSTGGMGIGLSLVKTIINSYGGQVWVENRVVGDYSQGSNFIILLKEA